MRYLVDKLPSNFYNYPQNIRIYYAPFTVGDLKHFFKVNSLVDLLELYASKITIENAEGFDVWNLFYGDFQFLVVQIYIVSVEDTVLDLKINCKCGASFIKPINLLDLKFKTLDKIDNKIEYNGLKLRPPVLKDMKEILGSSDDEVKEKLLDVYVESDKELGSRLELDIPVGRFLKIVKGLDIGLLPIEVVCEECGEKLEVETRLDFFTLV